MGAVTVDLRGTFQLGQSKRLYWGKATLSASYATGGDTFDATPGDLGYEYASINATGGYARRWDRVCAAHRREYAVPEAAQRLRSGVTELTNAWSPSVANASEADGTTHPITIETRDLPTGSATAPGTTAKLRVRYEATAAGTPTFTASYARGPAGAAFTAPPLLRGGGASDGLDRGSVWTVAKGTRDPLPHRKQLRAVQLHAARAASRVPPKRLTPEQRTLARPRVALTRHRARAAS